MPIMARTSGGIYTAVSDIYDTQGNAISTVYDNAGNTVFSSGSDETDAIWFNYTGGSGSSVYNGKSVKAGESKSGNALTLDMPLTFSSELEKTYINRIPINMKKYKGWHLRGKIRVFSVPVSGANSPSVTVELGCTDKHYHYQSGSFSFYRIKQLCYCYKQDLYVDIDETIPDNPNYYSLNLALRIKWSSWSCTNSTTKSIYVAGEVDVATGSGASIKLYKK